MYDRSSCLVKLEISLCGFVWMSRSEASSVDKAQRPKQKSNVSQHMYRKDQWPFQDPKLEVPTIYKAYVRPM